MGVALLYRLRSLHFLSREKAPAADCDPDLHTNPILLLLIVVLSFSDRGESERITGAERGSVGRVPGWDAVCDRAPNRVRDAQF